MESDQTLPSPPLTPPSIQGVKRTHRQMNDLQHDPASHSSSARESSNRLSVLTLPPLEPSIRSATEPHYPFPMTERARQRGFDYRRPVYSSHIPTTTNAVVDLTEDDNYETGTDRMSRAHNAATSEAQIIDLSADPSPPLAQQTLPDVSRSQNRRPPWPEGRQTPSLVRDPSSDVVFMHPQILDGLDTPSPRRDARQDGRTNNVMDLTTNDDREDEDDVIFVASRTNPVRRPHVHRGGPADPGPPRVMHGRPHRRRVVDAGIGHMSSFRDMATSMADSFAFGAAYLHRSMSFAFPAPHLDYTTPGFSLQVDPDEPVAPANRYQPPEPAKPGFTRSPKGQEVVCPNCGDELATGEDDEKRQVWVIKGCGHVYCGRCMHNRHKNKKAAGGRGHLPTSSVRLTKPFKSCVVDGCETKAHTKTAVVQIFL